jgi:hypothetical protein
VEAKGFASDFTNPGAEALVNSPGKPVHFQASVVREE